METDTTDADVGRGPAREPGGRPCSMYTQKKNKKNISCMQTPATTVIKPL